LRAQIVSTKEFTSPSGRGYRLLRTNYQDTHEEAQFKGVPELTIAATDDFFHGTDRKAAKTSLADADLQSYASIDALLPTLPADDDMLSDPDISKAADNQRVQREMRNVSVPAYLYASSHEKDNDYHLILGGPNATATGNFLNAEVSGLPTTGPFRQTLTVPRQAFKDYFGDNVPGRSYDIYDPPIPVTVTGSIFFDIDHPAGAVGPTGYKPQTAWEIHPISKIVLEPRP
jgi:hypothetical protein